MCRSGSYGRHSFLSFLHVWRFRLVAYRLDNLVSGSSVSDICQISVHVIYVAFES